jgi:hypothetical protein
MLDLLQGGLAEDLSVVVRVRGAAWEDRLAEKGRKDMVGIAHESLTSRRST